MIAGIRRSVRLQRKKNKIYDLITEYIRNNIKEFIIISFIFLIGIFLGVMFINYCEQSQKNEIATYVGTYLDSLNKNEVNEINVLKENLASNIFLAVIIWFAGSTLIGIPIVIGIIAFRGFCLGYAISASSYILGVSKGIVFCITTLLIHNILFIPAIISLGVSSLKLYQSILKDKRRENIKVEIIRHTIFSLFMLIVLVISAIIESRVSFRFLKMLTEYFLSK